MEAEHQPDVHAGHRHLCGGQAQKLKGEEGTENRGETAMVQAPTPSSLQLEGLSTPPEERQKVQVYARGQEMASMAPSGVT